MYQVSLRLPHHTICTKDYCLVVFVLLAAPPSSKAMTKANICQVYEFAFVDVCTRNKRKRRTRSNGFKAFFL